MIDNTNEQNIDFKQKKILVVEDDVFLGDVLMKYMSANSMSVKRVMSAEDAMKSLESEIPNLILLDIFLPGMNGLDFLDVLRKEDKTKSVPVIVVSNTIKDEDRQRVIKLNSTFFIKAAMTPEGIIDEIKKQLKASH